jgi:exo-beta-1,3-glucanase (GH17 family)
MKRIALAVFIGMAALLCASPGFSFIGIDYSPFHYPGQSPDLGTPITDAQIIADLKTLARQFQVIRTYGDDSTTRLDRIVPLAAANTPSLKVWLGVYEDGTYNGAGNKTFLDTAISQANTYPNVDAVVVGNECLPGDPIANPVSVAQMIADLQYVKAGITNKNIKVTTCLTYASGATNSNGLQVAPYCDVIMANIYPFYGGVAISNLQAIQNLVNAYQNIFVPRYPGKPIVIGETGWPSAPSNQPQNQAIPGVANEETFTNQVMANASKLGDTFLYSAFDEPWGPGGNAWGPHWGLWDQNRIAKFSLGLTTTSKKALPGVYMLLGN